MPLILLRGCTSTFDVIGGENWRLKKLLTSRLVSLFVWSFFYLNGDFELGYLFNPYTLKEFFMLDLGFLVYLG